MFCNTVDFNCNTFMHLAHNNTKNNSKLKIQASKISHDTNFHLKCMTKDLGNC